MTDTPWKATERTLARRLGGRRTGCTGQATADVLSTWLAIECKERKALPAWLLEAVQQARANAPEGRLPLVVLHQLGARHDGDLVVMTLADFQEWFGRVGPAG